MKNQPCFDKGGNPIGWLSRAVAVTNVVVAVNNSIHEPTFYILASKRGKGTPDPEFVGKWNLVCGYLDFNETIEEAACRETWEETGISVNPEDLLFLEINSNPTADKRQNVCIRFVSLLDYNKVKDRISSAHCEPDEVDEIKWIPLSEVDNYEWAFNHRDIIRKSLYLYA